MNTLTVVKTNYNIISNICLKNNSLKQIFQEKKNINVENSEDLKIWLEILSAINSQLAEKVGKIEVLLKWYKIMISKQDYSPEQINFTEKQITDILFELININLEEISLDEDTSNIEIEAKRNTNFTKSDNTNLAQEKIDFDFNLDISIKNEDEIKDEKLDFNFINNNLEVETEAITENNLEDINFDLISAQENQLEDNEDKANDIDLKPTEISRENEENIPLEAADIDDHIYEEGQPITIEELQSIFNKISKLSMRYLGGTLTKNYFNSTQPDESWAQKFQINDRGQITVTEKLTKEVSPQEIITFKQWTSKFIKKCSTIITNFPIMIQKNNILNRLS